MAMDSVILVANPGSASRKYALYASGQLLLKVHFEIIDKAVYVSTSHDTEARPVDISHISFACTQLNEIIARALPDFTLGSLKGIGLRVVAPSTYFQSDHRFDKQMVERLKALEPTSPLHIQAVLSEHLILKREFPDTPIIGVSDSAALAHKPDKAMYYGLPFRDAEKLDIKRFGYHGLSFQSAIATLRTEDKLAARTIICHLGGGASVAAVRRGQIIDSSMGFSPLEGLLMATRSGSLDVEAYEYLKTKLGMNAKQTYEYLNSQSGLLGVSEYSSDIRELLAAEDTELGARRALNQYVYRVQQSIGAMAAALGGADSLVFTGTVGERSREIRRRVTAKLLYLGFAIYDNHNTHLKQLHRLSKPGSPATVYVVPADEEAQIAHITAHELQ